MASPALGSIIRPATIRTWSWTASAIGCTPRTRTFSRPPSRVWKKGCTTSSGEVSGSSSASRSMPSR
jgi:hypothetical protein